MYQLQSVPVTSAIDYQAPTFPIEKQKETSSQPSYNRSRIIHYQIRNSWGPRWDANVVFFVSQSQQRRCRQPSATKHPRFPSRSMMKSRRSLLNVQIRATINIEAAKFLMRFRWSWSIPKDEHSTSNIVKAEVRCTLLRGVRSSFDSTHQF
jgi:hypothetical protein